MLKHLGHENDIILLVNAFFNYVYIFDRHSILVCKFNYILINLKAPPQDVQLIECLAISARSASNL